MNRINTCVSALIVLSLTACMNANLTPTVPDSEPVACTHNCSTPTVPEPVIPDPIPPTPIPVPPSPEPSLVHTSCWPFSAGKITETTAPSVVQHAFELILEEIPVETLTQVFGPNLAGSIGLSSSYFDSTANQAISLSASANCGNALIELVMDTKITRLAPSPSGSARMKERIDNILLKPRSVFVAQELNRNATCGYLNWTRNVARSISASSSTCHDSLEPLTLFSILYDVVHPFEPIGETPPYSIDLDPSLLVKLKEWLPTQSQAIVFLRRLFLDHFTRLESSVTGNDPTGPLVYGQWQASHCMKWDPNSLENDSKIRAITTLLPGPAVDISAKMLASGSPVRSIEVSFSSYMSNTGGNRFLLLHFASDENCKNWLLSLSQYGDEAKAVTLAPRVRSLNVRHQATGLYLWSRAIFDLINTTRPCGLRDVTALGPWGYFYVALEWATFPHNNSSNTCAAQLSGRVGKTEYSVFRTEGQQLFFGIPGDFDPEHNGSSPQKRVNRTFLTPLFMN